MLRIRYERQIRKWTQGDLGDLSDIPQATVSLIEIGRLLPTPAQLDRLARALGVPASVLLREVRPLPEPEEVEAAR